MLARLVRRLMGDVVVSGVPIEERSVGRISFLHAQDGPPERELKTRLESLFATLPEVRLAYLVRVSYSPDEDGDSSVALCVLCDSLDRTRVAQAVGSVFADLFGKQEHLDIVFLDGQQIPEIEQVATPFYRSGVMKRN